MSDKVSQVTDCDFDTAVLQSDIPVLVDFWAEWCAPCKMMAPALDQVAEEIGDKIKITKLDVAANNQISIKFGIRNIPALMIFKDGEVVAQTAGAMDANQLKAFINDNI